VAGYIKGEKIRKEIECNESNALFNISNPLAYQIKRIVGESGRKWGNVLICMYI